MSGPSILARRLNILSRAKYKFVVGNVWVLEKLDSARDLAHLGPQRDSTLTIPLPLYQVIQSTFS